MRLRGLGKLPILIAFSVLLGRPAHAQHISRVERDRAEAMLQSVDSDVRTYYYDPKLHGVDWDAKVNDTKKKIADAPSLEAAILQIAAVLEVFSDSHTRFYPPRDPIPQEYGWRFQMVGDRCFVTQVEPKRDAEAKGLLPGDEVLTINRFAPTRESVPKIEYLFNALVPQSKIELDLRAPSGKVTHVSVNAKPRQATTIMDYGEMTGRDRWKANLEMEDKLHLSRPRYKEFGDSLMILKLPIFVSTGTTSLEGLIDKARSHSTLVLDLRGNPGGAEPYLQTLVGGVFDHDVKIADRVTREGAKALMAKGTRKAFSGKLIVLVDSRSTSASELFARVVQIEKRGVVLGDRTSGWVMEAKLYHHQTGMSPFFNYVNSISEADLVMSDGRSLEHSGVTPDETILPSATDLANHRDPVLAHAAKMAGVALTPEDADNLFPYEWPKP